MSNAWDDGVPRDRCRYRFCRWTRCRLGTSDAKARTQLLARPLKVSNTRWYSCWLGLEINEPLMQIPHLRVSVAFGGSLSRSLTSSVLAHSEGAIQRQRSARASPIDSTASGCLWRQSSWGPVTMLVSVVRKLIEYVSRALYQRGFRYIPCPQPGNAHRQQFWHWMSKSSGMSVARRITKRPMSCPACSCDPLLLQLSQSSCAAWYWLMHVRHL